MTLSPPFQDFPVIVRQHGDLKVNYMIGRQEKDSFVIYMGLAHYMRHAKAEVVCEGGASIIILSPTPETYWYEFDDTAPGTERRCTPLSHGVTEIERPQGWHLGVDVQKDVIRIIGVRMSLASPPVSQDVPFTVEES